MRRKQDRSTTGEFEHLIGQRDKASSGSDRNDADRHNEENDDQETCDANTKP
jgi:hypothetical protein